MMLTTMEGVCEMTIQSEGPRQLVESGRYEEAIAAYTRLYREDGQASHLFARGTVYLTTADYVAALDDFRSVLSVEAPSSLGSRHYILPGICCWFLDRPRDAVELWRASVHAHFTDAAGGVQPPALLVYAGERMHDAEVIHEGLALLTRHWRNQLRRLKRRQAGILNPHEDLVHPGLATWPGAIVPFLLGHTDGAHLARAAASTSQPILQSRWQCQADFYLGLQALREGQRPQYQEAMRRAAASEWGKLEVEWRLALWEVERGFPEPAFS